LKNIEFVENYKINGSFKNNFIVTRNKKELATVVFLPD
jgi:hypothetical protein